MLKVTDDKTARRHPPLRIHPTAAPVLQPPACGDQSVALRTQCLKFKTDQAVDLKKLDKMNGLFLAFMGRGVSSNAGALPPPGALTTTRLPHLAASCSHRSRLVVQLHCGRLRSLGEPAQSPPFSFGRWRRPARGLAMCRRAGV